MEYYKEVIKINMVTAVKPCSSSSVNEQSTVFGEFNQTLLDGLGSEFRPRADSDVNMTSVLLT